MLATTRACHPEKAMADSVPLARLASVHRQFHLVAFTDRCSRATDHWPLFSRPAPHAAGRELALFFCPIPPWFVLSCNLSRTNARAIWLCFGAFLAPPVPTLRIHWPLATVLVLLTTILPSHAPRRDQRGQVMRRPSPTGYCLTPTVDLSKTEQGPISTNGPLL